MNYLGKVAVYGDPVDYSALMQIQNAAVYAEAAAMMADHHEGYSVPIGGVLAYDGQVSPSGVGYDIGCGNKAVRLSLKVDEMGLNIDHYLDRIQEEISFGIGGTNNVASDHELFDHPSWSMKTVAPLKDLARQQLGTIGAGNHFVDILVDETGHLWIGVHFGSRGFGYKVAQTYFKAGGASGNKMALPLLFQVGTPIGDDYIEAMTLAGMYAEAGRNWVCDKVQDMFGVSINEEVHNHHNFAWFENGLWVVRKGATPNFPGQRSFVGGSMGDNSYVLEGLAVSGIDPSLHSTVHGAGRVMSRTKAKAEINKQEWEDWIKAKGVHLRGGGLDEAPQAYKRIDEVLPFHSESVRIIHTLKPYGVVMAGVKEKDPYKD